MQTITMLFFFTPGYEVLYLIEPVDEYCIQSLPEFDGKKFQNVAKEGIKLDEKDRTEELEKEYEPLLKWMKEKPLKDLIEKATISQRLTESPCALVANSYGWSGNMERIMNSQAYAKAKDPSTKYVKFEYFGIVSACKLKILLLLASIFVCISWLPRQP